MGKNGVRLFLPEHSRNIVERQKPRSSKLGACACTPPQLGTCYQEPLEFQRTTHQGSLTSYPFWLSMPNQKRDHRPRVFYPCMAFLHGTRPLSWKGTCRRTVSLQLAGVPKPTRSYSTRGKEKRKGPTHHAPKRNAPFLPRAQATGHPGAILVNAAVSAVIRLVRVEGSRGGSRGGIPV